MGCAYCKQKLQIGSDRKKPLMIANDERLQPSLSSSLSQQSQQSRSQSPPSRNSEDDVRNPYVPQCSLNKGSTTGVPTNHNQHNSKQAGYVPRINAVEVQNGIVKLQICNLTRDSQWFNHCHKMEFVVTCYPDTNHAQHEHAKTQSATTAHAEHHRNSQMYAACNSRATNVQQLSFTFKSLYVMPFTYVLIRVPLRIYKHCISLQLRVRFIVDVTLDCGQHFQPNEWFTPSNLATVEIPSCLIEETQFKIGEVIKYRPQNIYFPKWGTVKHVVNEKYVQIEDFTDKAIVMDLPISRIYQPIIRVSNLLDFSDRVDADKCNVMNMRPLDVSQTDRNVHRTYRRMARLFRCLSKDVFADLYCEKYNLLTRNVGNRRQELDIKVHYKYIGTLFAVNILSFLHPDIEPPSAHRRNVYDIACMVNGCNRLLYLNSVRKHTYSMHIKGIRSGQNMMDPQHTVYVCDLCKVECSEYDYMYHCQSQLCNSHDICTLCCYNTIVKHTQLFNELQCILKTELVPDCIREITDFICGKVIDYHPPQCQRH